MGALAQEIDEVVALGVQLGAEAGSDRGRHRHVREQGLVEPLVVSAPRRPVDSTRAQGARSLCGVEWRRDRMPALAGSGGQLAVPGNDQQLGIIDAESRREVHSVVAAERVCLS